MPARVVRPNAREALNVGIGKGLSIIVFVLTAITLGVIVEGQHFGWWAFTESDPIIPEIGRAHV